MTDRAWIKIHTGLTNDPEHRGRMGIRVWLFMWLVDHAEWESGVVYNYTDKWAGEEMEMPPRTVERQRQGLECDYYIRCWPSFQCQHIMIMRWRNPKLVNPPQINIPGVKSSYAKLRTHPTQSCVPIPTENCVPFTLDSHSSESITSPLGEYIRLFALTPSPMDQMILDDLQAKYPSDRIVACIQEIHRRGISSIKYAAKMLNGGWPDNKQIGGVSPEFEAARLAALSEAVNG